ncbi:hypothetical protein CcrBL47_gp453 [Caulobacter phage BL47]|nr:hypothetical protein CcrBL47_gp453 [Caulobacter phage BL47]
MRVSVQCEGCGQTFCVRPCEGGRKYCTLACYDAHKPYPPKKYEQAEVREFFYYCGSLKKTGEAFGVTGGAIAYIVNKHPKVIPLIPLQKGRKPRKITGDTEKEIARLYTESDIPVSELCRKFDIDYQYLKRIRERLGLNKRSAGSVDWASLVSDIKDGATWTSAAERYGTNRSAIHKYIKEYNPDLLPDLRRTKGREEEILTLYKSGMTLEEVSDALDLRAGGVRKVILRLEPELLKRPKRSRPETFDNELAIRLFADGDKSYRAVAEIVGATENAVRVCIRSKAPHLIRQNWAKRRGFEAAKAAIRSVRLVNDFKGSS